MVKALEYAVRGLHRKKERGSLSGDGREHVVARDAVRFGKSRRNSRQPQSSHHCTIAFFALCLRIMATMLAVATTSALCLADAQSLRRTTSIAPARAFHSPPTCHAWTPDNATLILGQAHSISRYDSTGTHTKTIYDDSTGEAGAITALVTKDRGNTVIFSAGSRVHVLDAHTSKISKTFDTHKAPVVSLALSNDATLLASASAGAVHVHNLTHGSHTVMRGIPTGEPVTTCEFHPHARTRLLVGAGAQILVYDTTRPSGPLKTITIGTKKDASGEVVSIASSPFSKTLVAVACSGGTIALVDLEKEKDKRYVLSGPGMAHYSRPAVTAYTRRGACTYRVRASHSRRRARCFTWAPRTARCSGKTSAHSTSLPSRSPLARRATELLPLLCRYATWIQAWLRY